MPGARPSILSKSIVGVSLLIVFLILVWFLIEHEKARQLSRRRAWYLSDLDGRLIQAKAVRRHEGLMMMVVTVMAVALHLIQKLRENPLACQIRR
jgi:hypothetical protein